MLSPRPEIDLRVPRPAGFAPTRAELLIFGDIGESWSANSTQAADVVRQLGELPTSVRTILVRINSYGGSVADGLAIYNALLQHPARKTVHVDGVAASIASLIAMAGDETLMAETAMLMVHAPWGPATGNAAEHREFADRLDDYSRSMARAYARKTGRTEADMMELLQQGRDHWFSAEEAVAAGFADGLIEHAAQASLPDPTSAMARVAHRRAPAGVAAALRLSLSPQGAQTVSNPNPNQQGGNAPASPSAAITEEALAALTNRNQSIHASLRDVMDAPGIRDLYQQALADPRMSVDAVNARALAILGAQASPAAGGAPRIDTGGNGGDFIAAVTDAFLIRAGVRVDKPHAAARDFQRMSVLAVAETCISRSGRSFDLRAKTPEATIRAAMGTSDFPGILENSLNKAIRAGMEAPSDSHRAWVRVTEAQDFKAQSRVLLGSTPDLLRVYEQGEFTHGALSEDKASLQIGKYGRIIGLSWEGLVNDDLGAFLRLGPAFGLSAVRAEADSIYTQLTTASLDGVTMQDSKALFHADHANTVSVATGTGKPLTAAALSQARAKLRRQTSVGGAYMNLTPRTLLVPPDRESEAEILVASSTVHTGQAAADAAPGWLSNLQVIAEPRLANADVVYVLADSQMIDTGEVSVLAGSPFLAQEEDFDTKTYRWRLDHSFATAFLDYRGIVRLTLTAS